MLSSFPQGLPGTCSWRLESSESVPVIFCFLIFPQKEMDVYSAVLVVVMLWFLLMLVFLDFFSPIFTKILKTVESDGYGP